MFQILGMQLRYVFLIKLLLTFVCAYADNDAPLQWGTNVTLLENSGSSSNDTSDNTNSTASVDSKEASVASSKNDFSKSDDVPSIDVQAKQGDQILSKIDKSYRISVLEPKPAAGTENEPVFRRVSNSSNKAEVEVSVPEAPEAQLVRQNFEMDNQNDSENGSSENGSSENGDETTETATPTPVISPIIVYSILAAIILLVILLIIILVVVLIIVCTAPAPCEDSEDECCDPCAHRKKKSSKMSGNFCDEGSSEQTVELMERGTTCSSRKGSCKICPKTTPRSRNSKDYFVSCVCDLPGDELSPTSSASTSANTTFKRC